MRTKPVMMASALLLGLLGMLLIFLPQELSQYFELGERSAIGSLVLQVLGALYFGFAMVNWAAKGSLIGGIYARPVAIGNLTHFTVASLALLKGCVANPTPVWLAAAAVYTVFAVLFGIIFFTHPVGQDQ